MRREGTPAVMGGGRSDEAAKGGGHAMKVRHHVAVLLNQWRITAHANEGYEPLSGYITAIEFFVEADSPMAACEIAYGVTNSDLIAMHCDAVYADVVRTYREIGGFRFVTVDDMFEVDGDAFVCARFGFLRVPT
jgi:hypothetical protein